jgi:hypothetical protein
MNAKKRPRKIQKRDNVKTQRKTKRKLQKMWHPSNYLFEPHPELGIPECEEAARGYASPI